MRYLSVCSGIEAASIAWHRLGWTPVAFSEIEPFPSSVLAHRFPHVPNYGDMTAHATWPLQHGDIDLLVGGTPCQSFSVAGLRKGLSDPRGGLMLTYLEIAQRLRPRWVVWENVPGVLSSNGGRDFGSFLGALGDLGYGWAFRVLDAQWCRTHGHPRAVPQRRRRVFVVGRLIERGAGDGTAAASVLFERESVLRNLTAKRKTREEVAADAGGSASVGRWWDGGDCADTLTKCNANGAQRMPDKDNFGAILQPFVVRSSSIGSYIETDVGGTLRAEGGDFLGGESLAIWPAQVAATLDRSSKNTGSPGASNQEIFSQHGANLIPVVSQPVAHAFYSTGGTHGLQAQAEVAPAVKVGSGLGIPSPPAVAFTMGNLARGAGPSPSDEVFPTLKSGEGRGTDDQWPSVMTTTTIRRLTPRECERLQGFPDDWTLVPHRGKPAADGPRYKALGNSMAVNCMEWIGERIANYER